MSNNFSLLGFNFLDLFKFTKRGLLFILALLFEFLILNLIYVRLSYEMRAYFPLAATLVFIVLLGIVAYKQLTQCTEYELLQVTLQFFAVLILFGLGMYVIFIIPSSKSPILDLFSEIAVLITMSITVFITLTGMIALFYDTKRNLKLLLAIYFITLIINFVISFWFLSFVANLFTNYIFTPSGDFNILKYANLRFLLSDGTTGIFVFYAYKKSKLQSKNNVVPSFFSKIALLFLLVMFVKSIFEFLSISQYTYVNYGDYFLSNITLPLFYIIFGRVVYELERKGSALNRILK